MKNLQDSEKVIDELRGGASAFNVSLEQLPPTIKKFLLDVAENRKRLHEFGKSSAVEQFNYNIHAETLKQASENLFLLWKEQAKEMERISAEMAKAEAENLMSKAKNNKIFEIIQAERKDMINMGNVLINQNPNLTVILCNAQGDIIGMSKREDVGQIISKICYLSGGSGGGKKEFAQGRVELSKLMKIMPLYKS
jgi:alanyl-tRNA synthetase